MILSVSQRRDWPGFRSITSVDLWIKMRPDLDAVDKVSQRFLSVLFFMLPPPVPPRAHFDINIHTHTHTHTHVYDLPPAMTATRAPAPDTSSPPTELESLTALVDRLSVASMEAMRLAIEVKGTFIPSNSDSIYSRPHSKIASRRCCRSFCTRQRTGARVMDPRCPAHPRRPRRCSS
jgi:hypothetical protein